MVAGSSHKDVMKDSQGRPLNMTTMLAATEEEIFKWMGEYAVKLATVSAEKRKEREGGNAESASAGGDNAAEATNELPYEQQLDKIMYDRATTGLSENFVMEIRANLPKYNLEKLRQLAKSLCLSTSGSKAQLRERLKNIFRKEFAAIKQRQDFRRGRYKTLQYYDYLVVIDFECTCEEFLFQYPHEIIEFPAVLVNLHRMELVDTFRTYVQPGFRKKLDPFCIELTGIQQHQVDEAPVFSKALEMFYAWMEKHELGRKDNTRYAFVTDGPCDFHKFLQLQCLFSGINVPHPFRSFINIKRAFELKHGKLERTGQKESSLARMLKHYGIDFTGQAHSGLDDSKNIAVLAVRMIMDGIELRENQQMIRKRWPFNPPEKEQDTSNGENEENGSTRETVQRKPLDALTLQRLKVALDEGDRDAIERITWETRLPFRLAAITKAEFLSEAYKECDTCEESEEELEEKQDEMREEERNRLECLDEVKGEMLAVAQRDGKSIEEFVDLVVDKVAEMKLGNIEEARDVLCASEKEDLVNWALQRFDKTVPMRKAPTDGEFKLMKQRAERWVGKEEAESLDQTLLGRQARTGRTVDDSCTDH